MKSPIEMDDIKAALLPLVISDGADEIQRKGQRGASVLMPLVMRDQWHVILTQRPETMPSHAGQIAFPGGKREMGETAQEAALRETYEEIGVVSEQIRLLGRLRSFNAVGEYRVTPYVGVVDPDVKIKPDPREVADAFEVPLSFLMDAKNHVPRDVHFDQKMHRLWDMPYRGDDGIHRNIWGMTAMMIYRFYQRFILEIYDDSF